MLIALKMNINGLFNRISIIVSKFFLWILGCVSNMILSIISVMISFSMWLDIVNYN